MTAGLPGPLQAERVVAGEASDGLGGDTGDRSRALRRVFPPQRMLAQLTGAERAFAEIACVLQAIAEDDMHHGEREHAVGAGADGEMLVGQCGGARAVGIDHDQPRALAPRLFDERPQMHVGAVDIRAPRNHQPGVGKVLRPRAELHPIDRFKGNAAGLGADGAVELRRPQPMEEAAIDGGKAQLAQCPSVGIRQNALRAKLGRGALEFFGNQAERFVPRDALEGVGLAALFAAVASRAFGRAGPAPHGIEQPVRRVDAAQILRDLGAEESASDRMGWVAGDLGRAFAARAVGRGQRLHRDQHAAGVGAVQRADCMDHSGLAACLGLRRRHDVIVTTETGASRSIGSSRCGASQNPRSRDEGDDEDCRASEKIIQLS
jgi:hypothetical protein